MKKYRRKYRNRADYEDFKKMKRPGWSSGYAEYRDGAKKPVSLAKVWESAEICPSELEKRAALLLRPWTFSKWEHEAEVRYGLRLSLIDLGNDWTASDEAAADIVRRAFVRLGRGHESRPSHIEGQRHYTTPFECCAWCGEALKEMAYHGKRRDRFCCAEHAQKALQYFDWQECNPNASAVGQAAYRMTQRGRMPMRRCSNPACGEEFPLIREASTQRYCSIMCRDAVARTLPYRSCANSGCGKLFRPHDSKHRCCSPACSAAHRAATTRLEKSCAICHARFFAKTPIAMYCSNACKKRAYKTRKATESAIKLPDLEAAIFDQLFTCPINAVPRRLTAAAFDRLCEAA